jgi:hypothetical protein
LHLDFSDKARHEVVIITEHGRRYGGASQIEVVSLPEGKRVGHIDPEAQVIGSALP